PDDGKVVARQTVPATAAPGETVVVRQRFYLPEPRLWGPERPALYRAAVALEGADPKEATFGIRTVTVDPRKGLRLNGEPILLRGACIHHDNGPLGAASTRRAEERRIELLKAAGFNAIRAAHNPLSVEMLDACDRLGMLVMDEAFDMWTRFKKPYDYAADFPLWWREDLDALVAKDYNHPSVIMYSIGNEIVEVGTPHGARTARQLAEHLRAADPTRLITNGINALLAVLDEPGGAFAAEGGLNEAAVAEEGFFSVASSTEIVSRRTAESSSVLDVLGMNYGESRYALDQARFPERVLVGSETFPARIGVLWPLVEGNPNAIGDFTWTGWDYLGEVGIGTTVYGQPGAEPGGPNPGLEREFPALTAWCGDIDITGHRRPLSYYREIVFGLRTEPYLAVQRPAVAGLPIVSRPPWGWSDTAGSWTWPGFEGTTVDVEVYVDADEVALLLDGTEIDRAKVGTRLPRVADLRAEYRPGTLTAVAYRAGGEAGRTELRTASEPARLAVTVDRAQVAPDDGDLAFAAIELRDVDGHLHTGADRPVTVTVTGAGELAGMCSANPVTEERFADHTWRTFEGRALAVIRPTEDGEIVVEATADGLPATRTVITASAA
ncbi:MAG: DUF4982 domain-containing protein, partial [Promicromonosporaceae bacterium]|nr:DUF4982 domain-containing protein [Promicromonosporaceae bacterium]